MITVGELDTPVAIQEPTYTPSANYGGIQAETWANVDAEIPTVWAYLIFKGGKESEEGEQKVGEQKVDFYIRYETFKDLIQPSWRIRHLNAGNAPIYYYIEKIAHIDGRHKITRLTAVKKDNK